MPDHSYTLSGFRANLLGFLFIFPVIIIYGIPYIIIWCESGNILGSIIHQNRTLLQQAIDAPWIAFLLLLSGFALHELIHGLCMAIFAKNGWKSVSFGFNVNALAPYVHCKEPLSLDAYRLTLIMPGLLLGEVPAIISWFTGNILFLMYGILFCWASAGDLIILWMSRKITGGMLQDHPDKIGFVHLEE